jgi:hypothetical protein
MAKKGQTKSNATARSKAQRKYNSSPQQKKNRAARNKARAQAIKDGRVKKGDGKDVNHKKPLRSGGSNSKSNTNVQSKKKNRSNNGGTGGRPKGSKNKKKR